MMSAPQIKKTAEALQKALDAMEALTRENERLKNQLADITRAANEQGVDLSW